MAQADGIVSNASGAAVRADLNNQLAAVFTNHSGATEPSTTYAYQWWADTVNGVMKLRNATNTAWITLFQLDGEWTTLAVENGSAASPSIYFKDSGTDTGVYSPGTDQVAITTAGAQRVNFNGATEVVFNDGGADVDFRIEGDTEENLFKIDAGTDQVQVKNLNGGPLAGTRNRIINGDMRIDQRNAGASVTPTGASVYTVDRWNAATNLSNKFSVQQNAGSVTPPPGFINYLGVTSLSAYTVAAGEYAAMTQLIEGVNTADLDWGSASAKSVTLSFWVRSSLTGTFGGALQNNGGGRSYPFTFTISSANTWEQKSITVAGDTSGTWATNTNAGIAVRFGLGAGSTFSGTTGAWASANTVSATGATSVVATNGSTFYITGVQLEAGTVATPFERRSYGQELALCQRYFEQSFDGSSPVSNAGTIQNFNPSGASNTAALQVTFKVTKRAAPTVTSFSPTTGTSGQVRDGSGVDRAATVQLVGTNFAHITNSATGNAANYSAQWTASAEL